MKITLFKSLLCSTLLASVVACSTAPTHLIISPQVNLPVSNQLANKEANISVVDMRTSPHIVQILKKGEAATILSSKERIEDIISTILSKEWQKQGLAISPSAKNKITASIEKGIISVDQQSVSYTTQTEIIIKVMIENDKQTLTSQFKTRAHSEGALNADIAALEREFNQHFATLLKQMLASKDIKKFL